MLPLQIWRQRLRRIYNFGFYSDNELFRAVDEVLSCKPSVEEFEEWLKEAVPHEYWERTRNSALHIIAAYRDDQRLTYEPDSCRKISQQPPIYKKVLGMRAADGISSHEKIVAEEIFRAIISRLSHDEINYKNKFGHTALDFAIKSNNEEVALALLEAGASTDHTFYKYSRGPLHVAAGYDCRKVVEQLIKLGCDVDALNLNGFSPLHYALYKPLAVPTGERIEENKVIAEMLIAAGATIDYLPYDDLIRQVIRERDFSTAADWIRIGAAREHFRAREMLQHERVSLQIVLREAVASRASNLVRRLLDGNLVDLEAVDDWGKTVLYYAAVEARSWEITKMLLDKGASTECLLGELLAPHPGGMYNPNRTPPEVSRELMDFLLQLKSDIDLEEVFRNGEETFLMQAARFGDEVAVMSLLDHGANIGAKDASGHGVLYYAANPRFPSRFPLTTAKYVELLQLLISKGAAAGLTEEQLMEIFHHVVVNADENFVLVYLQRFLDKSKFTVSDFEKLAFLATYNMSTSKVLKYFVKEGGLDVNAVDATGRTILHRLLEHGEPPGCKLSGHCLKYLIRKGFHRNCKTTDRSMILYWFNQRCDLLPIEPRIECVRLMLNLDPDLANDDLSLRMATQSITTSCEPEAIYLSFCILRHITVLEVLGKTIDQCNIDVINTNPYLLNFHMKCKAELSLMQEHEICEGISWFRVLVEAKRFSRNLYVIETFENQSIPDKFAIYRDILVENFEKARKRPRLIEQAQMGLQRILPTAPFYLVFENICKHLSNKDLRNLILV